MKDYTYKCRKCGHTQVEQWHSYDVDLEIPMICDECGGEAILITER